MLRVCTLYSGSSANCALIETEGRALLVDAGGGVKTTQRALENLGLSLAAVEAIFITHEHGDHISGLKTILKYYKIPIIANKVTLEEIKRAIPEIDENLFCPMPTGSVARKDFFEVTSFRSPHDSVECVGYKITARDCSVGVLTDAGEETPKIKEVLSGCKTVVLEANHDKTMLMTGAYSYSLKQRIIGPYGHLSNNQSASLLSHLIKNGTERVLLAHLSKENNTPDIALQTVTNDLKTAGIREGTDVYIKTAPRSEVSEVFT